jgi:hypothetical protein
LLLVKFIKKNQIYEVKGVSNECSGSSCQA